MPSLSETQSTFARAVLDADRSVPGDVRSHLRPRPKKRFGVYRNNIYASLIDVLQGRFPVVARLLGEEFFRAMARVYVENHPPVSPMLMKYGVSFAEFLDGFEPVDDVPYIGDVARLEWAWNEAYHAADRAPVGPAEMQGMAPESAESLTFELHPSLRIVRSKYPVITIWTANSEGGEPDRIDAGAGGENALVIRPELSVEVRALPAGGADFIEALVAGAALADAATTALQTAEEFDLQTNLVGLLESGAVCAMRAGSGNGGASVPR